MDCGHNELISVIVPAYNAEDFIDQTLSSALAQTYRNLEIIVIDDGSSDRTAEIVKARADQDFRIHLIRQKNSGVAAARNLGIREARGKFIAPLDADDLWHPEKLQRQFETMRTGGQSVGLVYTWCSSVDGDGRIINRAASDALVMDFAYETLLYFNFIICGSVPLIRKDCLVEAGGYDQDLRAQDAEGCEDLKLYLAIAEKWKILAVPAFLVGYRMTANSMTSNVRRMKRSHELVLADARSRHPEVPEKIFRWSRSFNYFWMGIVALKKRQIALAVKLLTIAIINDPGIILRIRWQILRFIRPVLAFASFITTGEPSLRGQTFVNLPAPDFERVPALDKWPGARRINQIGTQPEAMR